MHQYADNTMKKRRGAKAPTIDFCFKDWSTSNSYFGAEAKNLYKNRPEKIKRYVSTGVENYTTGRYGSQSSENTRNHGRIKNRNGKRNTTLQSCTNGTN